MPMLNTAANTFFENMSAIFNPIDFVYIILFVFLFLMLRSILHQNRKYLEQINSEKEEFKSQLLLRVQKVSEERDEIQKIHDHTKAELARNQNTIENLNQQLIQVSDNFEHLKDGYDQGKINALSSQINELTARNKALETLLNNVYNKVRERNKLVHNLSDEIKAIRYPEIYIDFQNKIIKRKDNTEFILSSTAQQYKNDVFRYMEYVIRKGVNRVHLLEFGLNDPKFYIDAVRQAKVREFNYQGKFAKVKSGINKTFMENIKKEFILTDEEKIFAYCSLPDTVMRITSKERDIDITLSPINRNKMPEILTFFGYKTFDYYRVNSEIIIKSNIQESKEFAALAQQIGEKTGKMNKLEEALYLDNKNYQALSHLVDCHPFNNLELVQAVTQNLDSDIRSLEEFLSQPVAYQKRITNTARIKQEYREIYSWRYVNAAKGEKLIHLGELAFDEVIKYEINKLEGYLESLQRIRSKVTAYFDSYRKLKEVIQFLAIVFKKPILSEIALEFIAQSDAIKLLDTSGDDLSLIKHDFINRILAKNGTDNPEHHSKPIMDFIEWLQLQGKPTGKATKKYWSTFIESYQPQDTGPIEELGIELFKKFGII